MCMILHVGITHRGQVIPLASSLSFALVKAERSVSSQIRYTGDIYVYMFVVRLPHIPTQ